MYNEVKFYDEFYKLNLINRLKFVLSVWSEGSFKKDLQNILQLSREESIDAYSDILKKSDFLSIDNPKSEPFYYISDENLKNIFNHICSSAKMPQNDEIFNLVKNFRTDFSQNLIQNIPYEMDNDPFFEKENLIILLENNIAFFFLYIIGFDNEFRKNEKFNEFYINVVKGILKYNARLYSSDPNDSARQNKAKREFLRETVRSQTFW